MTLRHRFAVSIAAAVTVAASSPAAEPIKPPFGLTWGETQERMARLLQSAKATIVERRNTRGCEAWDVEGLVKNGPKRAVFYFRERELVEVELQYQYENWTDAKYREYMQQVRERFDQHFGTGQKIADRREPNGEVIQTIETWKWNQNNSAIELIYYAAQGEVQTFQTLSVHYRVN